MRTNAPTFALDATWQYFFAVVIERDCNHLGTHYVTQTKCLFNKRKTSWEISVTILFFCLEITLLQEIEYNDIDN